MINQLGPRTGDIENDPFSLLGWLDRLYQRLVGGNVSIGTNQATTSGTSKDFTFLAGAARITVNFSRVSTNGTSNLLVQLGGVTSGYDDGASTDSAGRSTTNAGFLASSGNGAAVFWNGTMTLTLMDATTWVAFFVMTDSASGFTAFGGGSITLSSPPTTLRVTTVNGTDAFDSGAVNITTEQGR